MGYFRKRPITIEARRWDGTGEGATPILNWILIDGTRSARYHEPVTAGAGAVIAIDTLEGTMYASPGDWIVRGMQGEFYPIRDNIFHSTYDPVV